jgi:hypothetical protein
MIQTLFSGSQDLRAPDERVIRHIHPSIVETLPGDFPDLKHEFARSRTHHVFSDAGVIVE